MNKCQIKINKPLYLCENSPWFVFLLEGISWRILQAWNFNDLLEFSYFQTSMYVHQALKRVKTSLKVQCKLRVYIIRKCIYVPFAIFYLFFLHFFHTIRPNFSCKGQQTTVKVVFSQKILFCLSYPQILVQNHCPRTFFQKVNF